jgi:hypothetical protein
LIIFVILPQGPSRTFSLPDQVGIVKRASRLPRKIACQDPD